MSVSVSCKARGVPALSSANEGLTPAYSLLTANYYVTSEGKHPENDFCYSRYNQSLPFTS